ncbi:hypothetical protein RJ639_040823 [Escallonia herrerae]|uniref:Uncharacterized protein n=1 Tax=Escallonia herrerae TaxID=1293975 RepID=A0AA89BBU4_9ASTE|nr:hypothetical protein RJ639_040823 [Escallonia herrerae]
MLDGIPILHQVHELQDIANKICELDGKLPESFQVGMIIAKLPPSWKDYRKKLLHREKKFTLEKIQKHLRIEEESRNRDKKGEAEFNSKVNYVDAASGKSFHALQVKKEDNMFKRNTNHNKNKKKSSHHLNREGSLHLNEEVGMKIGAAVFFSSMKRQPSSLLLSQ